MMKKLLSILLASVLIITALCGLSVSAEENTNAISVYSGAPDYDFWLVRLEGSEREVTIMTADQLMAFADLTLGYDFAGWTIKLGADMVINAGDASTWATTAPQYTWKCSTTWAYRFAGNFDGQGHVISGLYSKYGQECGLFGTITGGNTIQNVSIVNSYFEFESQNADGDVCLMGGIVGYIDGNNNSGKYDNLTTTIKNVYVNATLFTDCAVPAPNGQTTKTAVGGIVGMMGNTSYQDLVIENVVFEGDLTSSYRNMGGIIGRTLIYSGGTVTIKNCSVDADICSINEDEPNAGGVIGQVGGTNVVVEDCVVKATFKTNVNKMTAAFIGFANVTRSIQIKANDVLLVITPIATGDSGVIFRSMLMNYYTTANLTVDFSNITYVKGGFVTYPEGMLHIAKTGGEAKISGGDFEATIAAAADVKGQAVFTGWTAVDGGYPIPAGVTIPTIDLDVYKNAASTTPATPDNGGDNNTDNSNNNNNNDNNSSNNNNNNSNTNTNNGSDNNAGTTETTAATTDSSAEEKSGCGSSMGLAGISALALAAVIAVVPFKKKEEN